MVTGRTSAAAICLVHTVGKLTDRHPCLLNRHVVASNRDGREILCRTAPSSVAQPTPQSVSSFNLGGVESVGHPEVHDLSGLIR